MDGVEWAKAEDIDVSSVLGLPKIADNDLPIVDVWLDIGAHLNQDDIPDPVEFIQAYDTLVR